MGQPLSKELRFQFRFTSIVHQPLKKDITTRGVLFYDIQLFSCGYLKSSSVGVSDLWRKINSFSRFFDNE